MTTIKDRKKLFPFVATVGTSIAIVRGYSPSDATDRVARATGTPPRSIRVRPATHADRRLLDDMLGGSRALRDEWADDLDRNRCYPQEGTP